jgi:hypothetical protein
MILGHQHSEYSAIAAAFFKSVRDKIITAKADISTLPGSGHLNFALTLLLAISCHCSSICVWSGQRSDAHVLSQMGSCLFHRGLGR